MSNTFISRGVAGTLLLATSAACVAQSQEVLLEPTPSSALRADPETGRQTDSGKHLFTRGEFGGNGRTCETCHSLNTEDITLDHIQVRFAEDPFDPLFRAIDSDDGTGASYDRLLTHATFRVFVDLPSNIQLADDPAATRVALFRSTLPTNNIALDPFIMWDGREPDLPHQALSAFITHSEITEQPSAHELQRIAGFQEEASSHRERSRASPTAALRRSFPRDARHPSAADKRSSSLRPESSTVLFATAAGC